MLLRLWVPILASVCLVASGSPATAQEKSGIKPGFVLPQRSARILLIRPTIKVGAQSTGGMFEPNADWTAQAKENLAVALAAAQTKLGNEILIADEPIGPAATTMADYRALFSVLADSVIRYQFFVGNRLPTKKRKDAFEWTMGPGVADLAKGTGADYALFLFNEDQYGSTGRKILQAFAAMAYVSVKSGEHKGFAGLVDLHTGDLVWLNADLAMGGDVRTPDGAQKRVSQLLKNFPGSSQSAAPASAAK
ncbi:hypothetical protein J2X47_002110 [Sphingomonas sp. BE270]|mgnify:CR=1 FL=1|jgi:hypothetical protein|uniref:hypothetical protein n=3 Tax=Pseudomonadota TaxID=1224 RepID=UPI00053CEF44|nr:MULTISPECIES: hypothetical protein [unclassified Sphingomonas]MDR6850061.1 hypothetical protein [Sphingomonas sp. BE137]MDR7257930.1 hypothetical protein [Sphingomonas sp. BE270]